MQTFNVGDRFGTWTILAKPEGRLVCVRCACGMEGMRYKHHLVSGRSISCRACRNVREPGRMTHGHTRNKQRSPEFRAWMNMLQRCKLGHKDGYAERGIIVCARWKEDFSAFLDDMGLKPGPNYSVDRKNNDGNYEPDNCRWATPKEQANNRRKARPRRLASACKL